MERLHTCVRTSLCHALPWRPLAPSCKADSCAKRREASIQRLDYDYSIISQFSSSNAHTGSRHICFRRTHARLPMTLDQGLAPKLYHQMGPTAFESPMFTNTARHRQRRRLWPLPPSVRPSQSQTNFFRSSKPRSTSLAPYCTGLG